MGAWMGRREAYWWEARTSQSSRKVPIHSEERCNMRNKKAANHALSESHASLHCQLPDWIILYALQETGWKQADNEAGKARISWMNIPRSGKGSPNSFEHFLNRKWKGSGNTFVIRLNYLVGEGTWYIYITSPDKVKSPKETINPKCFGEREVERPKQRISWELFGEWNCFCAP